MGGCIRDLGQYALQKTDFQRILAYGPTHRKMKNCTILILLVLFSFGAAHAQSTRTASAPGTKILRFFPNPATTYINFEFQKDFDRSYVVQVYNFLGKKVADITQVNQRSQIDVSGYTRGIYIYQLKDQTGKVIESGKFQIER